MAEWVEGHYQLSDESGKRITFERWGSDALIDKSRASSSTEQYLVGTLAKGRDYVFDYVPHIDKPQRYRLEFTAPSEGKDPWHQKFVLVKN